jgi:hypothetical protein
LVHDSSKEATELTKKKKSEVSTRSKVGGFYGEFKKEKKKKKKLESKTQDDQLYEEYETQ